MMRLEMNDLNEVSVLLGVNENELIDILAHMYQYIKIGYVKRKDGKRRKVNKAIGQLRIVHERIKLILQEITLPLEFHGIKGTSPATNASIHIKNNSLLKIDIKHYFPSIKYEKICWLFTELGYSRNVAEILTTLTTLNGKLVTGFSTSSLIANLIFLKTLYPRIKSLCDQQNIEFTVFADDVTFSSNKDLSRFINLIRKIFNSENFEINEKKLLLCRKNEHQEITGYVVNEKLNISKKEYREIRALLYRCKRDGIETATNLNREKAQHHLMGKIQRVYEVNPQRGEKLKRQFNSLSFRD